MASSFKFSRLMEPYHIGRVITKNRMVKVAAGTGFFHPDDMEPGKEAIAFYEAIARGGIGLLTVEAPAIDDKPAPNMYHLDDDKYIPGLRKLTDVIHKYGCPTFIQFYHRGALCGVGEPITDLVAASAVSIDSALDLHSYMPRELTISEIQELVDKFASAAVRAQKAGFDGVEINAGSSHLINTFISRFWNKRHDIYGCDNLENRTRFIVEIVREIKKRLGNDFPVTVLINGLEVNAFEAGANEFCTTIEEGKQIALILEKAGADALHIRSDWIGNHVAAFLPELLFYPEPCVPLKYFPKEIDTSRKGPGAVAPIGAIIRKTVSIPVLTVGRLDPLLGDEILKKGMADFIGFNRRLVADPDLPNKVASGKLDDIAPCTSCIGCMTPGEDLHCRINANYGIKDWWEFEPTKKRKKVLVIGGGPAGLEAARVSALRGHEVTLYDKSSKLGGSLPMAAMVKGTTREDLPALIRYFTNQLTKLGVTVILGKEANISTVEKIKPDVLILAMGGMPSTPKIIGYNKHKVVSSSVLRNTLKFYLRFFSPKTLRWLTKIWMPLGKQVVIIGGNIQGCQLAEYLVERGRKVTVVDESQELGTEMSPAIRIRLIPWLQKKATLLTGIKYSALTDNGLTIITKEGKQQIIEADSIVSALPLLPNADFPGDLKGKVTEIYLVGDCKKPGLIRDAIADGSIIARKV